MAVSTSDLVWSACHQFLSQASQAALTASAAISSQICHNILIPRTLSQVEFQPPRRQSTTNSARHFGRVNNVPAGPLINYEQIPPRCDEQFDAYLRCQGPRALELGNEDEYRRHYHDSLNWRKNMGVELAQGASLSPSNSVNPTNPGNHGVFERSVERMPRKTMGTEELDRDWVRFCNTYNSRGTQQAASPSSSVNVVLAPCKWKEVDDRLNGGNVEDRRGNNAQLNLSFSPAALKRPQPVEPPTSLTPLSTKRKRDFSSAFPPSAADSIFSAALSARSTQSSPSPIIEILPEPINPRSEPPQKRQKQSSYYALYPADHRLGFDCTCSACEHRNLKKTNPSRFETLRERRQAKNRKKFQTPNPSFPQTPEEKYYTYSPHSEVVSAPPGGYFRSGNVMVPYSDYPEQLGGIAPSTWILGDNVAYGAPIWDTTISMANSALTTGYSSGIDDEMPTEEHGNNQKRRKR